MPMLIKANFTHIRKISIIAIFGMGIFSMIACIVARLSIILYQNTNQGAFNDMWLRWTCRESSAAVIVGNVYYLAPLLKRLEDWWGGMKRFSKQAAIPLHDCPEGEARELHRGDTESQQNPIMRESSTRPDTGSRKEAEADLAYVPMQYERD